ncbi:MAG TPA: LppX_LprAFG lipoprotein [Humibacillus xanthopallidus]|nr:LppX_LprAFG lipoprotein [Humibacillus xanthopallidus]
MTLTFRRVAVALILPAVLATAACGKQAEPTPGATTAAGATSSAAATTSDTASSTAQPYQDKAALIAGLKSGATSATTAHVSMDMTAAGEKISMQGDTKIDATNPAMQVSMDMGSQMKLDMLLVDKKIYLKGMPGLPAGKWAVVDSSSDIGKQMESSLAQADPTKMYDQFEKAVTDVKPMGEDSVDGDKAYKYELTLDTKAMGASLAGSSGVKVPDTITYLAWVDDANHLRKVTFDIMGSKATMTMSKYGEPVDITAPPASQTVKAPM